MISLLKKVIIIIFSLNFILLKISLSHAKQTTQYEYVCINWNVNEDESYLLPIYKLKVSVDIQDIDYETSTITFLDKANLLVSERDVVLSQVVIRGKSFYKGLVWSDAGCSVGVTFESLDIFDGENNIMMSMKEKGECNGKSVEYMCKINNK